MKKRYLLVILFVLLLSACSSPEEKIAEKEANEQVFLENTLDVSRDYVMLRLRTENILVNARDYSDYSNWDNEMNELISDWKKFEKSSTDLERNANNFSKNKLSLLFINEVNAITSQEINDVFDNAPAGKKIKTLAKFLNVDAKRAYKILQQTQNEVQADAWNEAGDEFQKLETAAVVIKDGCKVAGFVGGVVLSGGTSAIATAGVVTQTAVVVTGADLVLEITEDAANIALGNNNDVSEIAGNIRIVTEPAAAILAIADMPKNAVKGIDKLNAWMFGADQFRTIVQEGKVIGIKLPVHKRGEDDGEIGMVVISPEDIDEWLEENGYERHDGDVEEIMAAYEEDQENNDNNENIDGEKIQTEDDSQLSPEEVVESLSGDNIEGEPSIAIVKPVEETFIKGQARPWFGEVYNYNHENGQSYVCNWNFYIDGEKYQEMKETCGFVSTFIEKNGHLKAELVVDFLQGRSVFDENGEYIEYVKDVVNTLTTSKEYTVSSYGN